MSDGVIRLGPRVQRDGAAKVGLWLLVWLVLLALGGEVLARWTLTSPSVQLPDAQLGYVNRPKAWLFQANEGFQDIYLNSLGLNDNEVGPKTSKRLLFIGDSMLLAHQVPREKNYTSLVEQATGFDIVNGGRDAMGPAQWNIMVDRLAPKVQPDAVVMMMTRGDAFDLRDAKATIVKTGPGLGDVRIDQAKPEHDFVQEKFGPLLRQSALATFLARRGNLFINGITKGDGWLGYFLRHGHKAPPAKNETDGFPTQAIEVQLTQLMQVAEARGPVAFISIPSFVYHAHGQTELEPRSQVEAEIFPAAARRAGIPFVDLGPELRAIYAREQRPFSGFDNSQIGTGHLNTYGHSVVAKLIAAHLPDLLAQAQADHAHALGK